MYMSVHVCVCVCDILLIETIGEWKKAKDSEP